MSPLSLAGRKPVAAVASCGGLGRRHPWVRPRTTTRCGIHFSVMPDLTAPRHTLPAARRNLSAAIDAVNTVMAALPLARQHSDPAVRCSTYLQVSGAIAEHLAGFVTRIASANLHRLDWVRTSWRRRAPLTARDLASRSRERAAPACYICEWAVPRRQ